MRMLKAVGAAALLATLGAGLVQAQTVQPPAPQAPQPTTAPQDDSSEEPPPAPGEVTPPTVYKQPVPTPIYPEEPEAPAAPEKKAEAPAAAPETPVAPDKRARHQAAVIQALDKITAETMRFEAKVGVPVRYKGLVFTVRACETSAPDEPMKDTAAYVEVRAEPRAQAEQRPSRQVFKGWMYASSPGLNPFEHPVYDAWLIACKA
ncbi:DUF2155 domain-containing protein [Caulobacter sp. 17J65-9]|uniref:DUF2155 domain-containing protein n=1 Tax=Caulobacter sp. 17J65-9 TaxID=2709382 RepID=UPI0013CB571D|nr:DUF2155 domain-containing protein [Caulobacter sp. 17J65-9]NEX95148.1 DUF2155 domain-containing protein [Caulobacter sp. 17J65-9]